MDETVSKSEGWRERKRRQTRRRIAESAIKLFASDGYEATTLDAIAEAAGISRRTFFYYFSSKEEVLAAWQQGLPEAFRDAVLEQSPDRLPIQVVQTALLGLLENFDAHQAVIVNQIVHSSEQLRAVNQAKYLQMEQTVFGALCELWPQAKRRKSLRMVAVVTVGALRLAIDEWTEEKGKKPLVDYLKQSFDALNGEFSEAAVPSQRPKKR